MNKILIADDDSDVRDLCRMVLSGEGFEVVEAEDAPSGIARAREQQPDLILLDWMMPEVDGIDALRDLKRHPLTREIPVVMLTALDGVGEITLATYHGADGYMTKPFEAQDLLHLVQRFTAPAEIHP
jgi:two-component system phosphate regulon response regulator PhoB